MRTEGFRIEPLGYWVELELPDGLTAEHYNDSWHGDVLTIHIKVKEAK